MKKILGVLVVLILILAVGGYITANYFLGSIAKAGVNKFGPTITQTKVELNDAKISPFSGVGTLTGLSVGNPPGWSQADAFRIGKVHLNVEPKSVLSADPIVINELTIEQPEFLYETKLVASNIGDILKNIEQSMGGAKEQPKTEEGKPVKMVIKKLTLREGRVTLGVGTAAMTMPMPAINMTDIGVAEGGLPPAQIAFAVMRNVLTNVVAATTGALTQVGGTSGAAAVESARQVGEALKGIFGGGQKQPPQPAKK